MRKKLLAVLLVTVLCVGTASAQLGSGIVYDPTNYANAVLRYKQLVQHLAQLQKTYTQIVTAYNLALQMSRNIHNMPARYRALFSNWRNVSATNTYGNTSGWLGGVPRVPKSLAVFTRPAPKCPCQMRLTMTRAVNGFFGSVNH